MDDLIYDLCQAFFSNQHSEVEKEKVVAQEQTAQDQMDAEIELLTKHYGELDGKTIEISLTEMLSLIPRKRKRVDAYSKLTRRLAIEKNCNLNIKTTKNMKRLFIGGKVVDVTTDAGLMKKLDALMTARLRQTVRTTATISGNVVSVTIPVVLNGWNNSDPNKIPDEIVWLLLGHSLPVPHFPNIPMYVDRNEFAKLYKAEAKGAKASKVNDVDVSITNSGVVLTVEF